MGRGRGNNDKDDDDDWRLLQRVGGRDCAFALLLIVVVVFVLHVRKIEDHRQRRQITRADDHDVARTRNIPDRVRDDRRDATHGE